MVDSDSSCPECGSRDFTRDDDELSCIACGLVLEDNIMESASGSSPFAPRQGRLETQTEWLTRTRKLSTSPAKITAIQNADEDPEWANSPVKVDSPPPPSAITPKGEHRFATLNKDAMTYLGANPSSDVDRSELFRPFYAIHPNLKQISDEEVKKNRPAVGIDKSLSKDFTITDEDQKDLRSKANNNSSALLRELGLSTISPNPVPEVAIKETIEVVASKGILGDRYFHDFNGDREQITLIESENIDYYNNTFNTKFTYLEFRRNIVTKNIKLGNEKI